MKKNVIPIDGAHIKLLSTIWIALTMYTKHIENKIIIDMLCMKQDMSNVELCQFGVYRSWKIIIF